MVQKNKSEGVYIGFSIFHGLKKNKCSWVDFIHFNEKMNKNSEQRGDVNKRFAIFYTLKSKFCIQIQILKMLKIGLKGSWD